MKKTLITKKIATIFISLLLIFYSGHMFQATIGSINYFLVLCAIPALFYTTNKLFNEALISSYVAALILIAMTVLSFASSFARGYSFYLTFLSYILVAFFISHKLEFQIVVDVFLKVMTALTLISLVGYFLVNNTAVLSDLPKITNINDVEYGVAVVFNYITAVPYRNCGMFWEPGLFASFLTLALIFELVFKTEKVSFFRILIFILGLITANSSAGFALLFLCLALLFCKKRESTIVNILTGLFMLILIIAIPLIFFNLENIIGGTVLGENEYVQKLFADNLQQQSRFKAIEHNWKVFLDNPFFGAGISSVTQQMEYVADTSTSTYLMSVYGIFGAAYTLFWIYGVFRQKNITVSAKIIIIVLIMIIINKEPHHQNLFTLCFMFFLLKSDNLVKEKAFDKISVRSKIS